MLAGLETGATKALFVWSLASTVWLVKNELKMRYFGEVIVGNALWWPRLLNQQNSTSAVHIKVSLSTAGPCLEFFRECKEEADFAYRCKDSRKAKSG